MSATSQFPLTGALPLLSVPTGSVTPGLQLPSSGSTLASEQDTAGTTSTGGYPLLDSIPGAGAVSAAASALQAAKGAASALRPARIAAFIIGLLLIAGGIFALKPVRETVTKVVETGRKAASVAGEVAAAA